MPIRFNPIEQEFDFSKHPMWGSIRGTITDQADLMALLGSGYVPYSGAVANVDLGNYSLKTSKTDLRTTPADGFILENPTPATAPIPVQMSPRARWSSQAFATGVNVTQTYDFAIDVLPVSQATNIDGIWRLRSSLNGAAYVDRFGVVTEGNDTKLRVGGVNFFGKAGNQNDFYAGSVALRFDKNDGSVIYAAMANDIGTWSLTPSTLTGALTTPAMLIAQTLNTSGKPSVQRIDITRTAAGTNYAGFEIRENTGSGFNSKFKVLLNTGSTSTLLSVNDASIFAQGSGSTEFYGQSKIRFYDSTGGAPYGEMTATGFWRFGDGGSGSLSFTSAAPYRFTVYGNGSKVSYLVRSSHTVPTPYYETRSSRGGIDTPSATQAADILGGLLMGGYGASQWNNQGAAVVAIANETFTNSNGGTYLKFQTTPDGSVTRQDVLFLGANGLVQIGGMTNAFAALKSSSAVLMARLADDSDDAEFTAKKLTAIDSIVTGDPGGGNGAWKLGKIQGAAVALDAANYVEIDIDGAVYKLALVT